MKKKSDTHVILALPAMLQSKHYLFSEILPADKQIVGNFQCQQGPSGEAMVFDLLTPAVSNSIPYAAISALGHGLDAAQGYWLHMDPVELLVDGGNICMVGKDHLSLIQDESKQLVTMLNRFLAQDNLTLLYGEPGEWFLNVAMSPQVTTKPLRDVVAQDIKAHLPVGQNQSKWHTLLTELQMLLFDHEVNQLRQKQGRPLINSVWLWGEGMLPQSYPPHHYTHVWTNSSFVKGFYKLIDRLQNLSSLDTFDNQALHKPGRYLIVCNHFNHNIKPQIASLFDQLQDGMIKKLSIYSGMGEQYHWTRKQSFLARLLKYN